jgi:hypothetical protein
MITDDDSPDTFGHPWLFLFFDLCLWRHSTGTSETRRQLNGTRTGTVSGRSSCDRTQASRIISG